MRFEVYFRCYRYSGRLLNLFNFIGIINYLWHVDDIYLVSRTPDQMLMHWSRMQMYITYMGMFWGKTLWLDVCVFCGVGSCEPWISFFTSEEKLGLILNFNTLSNGSESLLTSTFGCILLSLWGCFLGLAAVVLFLCLFFKRHLNEFECNFWWLWNSCSEDTLFGTSVFITFAVGVWAKLSINKVCKVVEKSNWSHVKSFLELHLHLVCNWTSFGL